MNDRLERLRSLREAQSKDASAEQIIDKTAQAIKDSLPEATLEPGVPRDWIEELYFMLPNWLEGMFTFAALVFFTWFLAYLLAPELYKAWKSRGVIKPICKLSAIIVFNGFIWISLWTLTADTFLHIRGYCCGAATVLGILASLNFVKEKAKDFFESGRKALELQKYVPPKKPTSKTDA